MLKHLIENTIEANKHCIFFKLYPLVSLLDNVTLQKKKILSYTLLNLIFNFIFVLYLLIQIVLRRHYLSYFIKENATSFRVQFGSLCKSNGTHCSSITVRWRRWTTEGEKAFVDDRENGKRKGRRGRVFSHLPT